MKVRCWPLVLLIGLSVAACGDDDDRTTRDACGDGQQVAIGCVFDDTLIIEGFLCPAEAPVRHDFADEVVCSTKDELSEDDVAAVREAGYAAAPIAPGAQGDDCPREGAMTEAADGCNTCSCGGGTWDCTDMSCDVDVLPAECEGMTFPSCPDECAPDVQPGGDCQGAAVCGNNIGDGCTCTDGRWECTVHAPLSPGECNLVCL